MLLHLIIKLLSIFHFSTLISLTHWSREVKFAIQIGSDDWSQLWQILDFERSVSVHFGSASQNVLKRILKKSHICPIWGPSDLIWMSNLTSLLWTFWSVHSEAKRSGMSDLSPKMAKLIANGTNLGLFQIRFQYIFPCTEIWSEKVPDLSHLGPIWPFGLEYDSPETVYSPSNSSPLC